MLWYANRSRIEVDRVESDNLMGMANLAPVEAILPSRNLILPKAL
jgi:hypothetical protein